MSREPKRCPRYDDCGPMRHQEFHYHDSGNGDCSEHWICDRCGYRENAVIVHLTPRDGSET